MCNDEMGDGPLYLLVVEYFDRSLYLHGIEIDGSLSLLPSLHPTVLLVDCHQRNPTTVVGLSTPSTYCIVRMTPVFRLMGRMMIHSIQPRPCYARQVSYCTVPNCDRLIRSTRFNHRSQFAFFFAPMISGTLLPITSSYVV